VTPVSSTSREPGYIPPVSYDEVTSYEPYPDAPADLPYQVPYAPEYAHQTLMPTRSSEPTPTVPQAVRRVVREFGAFHGRLDRPTFWMAALGLAGGLAVLAIALMTIVMVVGIAVGSTAAGVLVMLAFGFLLVSGLGVAGTLLGAGVRRLHDTGMPGWMLALWFVPFGWIAVVVLLSRQTQPYDNAWGPQTSAR
jgi:uncharacterized membrane protein YhaH (DUF805 family)